MYTLLLMLTITTTPDAYVMEKIVTQELVETTFNTQEECLSVKNSVTLLDELLMEHIKIPNQSSVEGIAVCVPSSEHKTYQFL